MVLYVCRNITINKLGRPRNQQASLMFQFEGQEFLHGFAIDPVILNFVTLFNILTHTCSIFRYVSASQDLIE